jgi:aminoglycoside phosphotransferase (APT) family kinase protein
MEYGDGGRSWKEDLLNGTVDTKVTQAVADILSKLHINTMHNKVLSEAFRDNSNFVQLRIDPYLTTTAERHPNIKPMMDDVIESLLSVQTCVVHGDFSPKNLLLLPDQRIWLLDCECAHYGNPAFDIAFCTNHLLLKSVHLKSVRHLTEAQTLWASYWKHAHVLNQEKTATRTLAALMLARVDGKSPGEYLTIDDRNKIRKVARQLILDKTDDFSTVQRDVLRVILQE